jgi:hypothetical protein
MPAKGTAGGISPQKHCRSRETVLASVHRRLRGTAALQVSIDQRCHGRLPLPADSLEATLRRSRETVLASVHRRLRGTAALQLSIDQRCHGRLPLPADSLEDYAPS